MEQPVEAEERIGPYRLIRRLGQGGMGVVYLAEGPERREVALKVLRSHVAHDPTARARLEREVTTLRRIDHPGVADCVVVVHGATGASPRLVAYVVPEGPDLDRTELRTRSAGRLPRYALPAAIRPIEHIPQVGQFRADRGDADHGAPVQVVRPHLGHRHLGAATQIGQQRAQQAALLLQRVHVAQQQVELDPPDPHGHQSAANRGA